MADESDRKAALAEAEPPAPPSDAGLAARAAAGDETAFELIFERHRRRVALIAGRFFRRREQVEEVVQETFTKAYFALQDFDGKGDEAFAAWLARIAFNASYDELRRQKRRPESLLSDVSDGEAEWLRDRLSDERPGAQVESAAVSRDLAAKLLARLSPEDRLVLVMLEVEGQSVAEIARAVGWSAPKVKVRAHRARAALRRALARYL
ncbi:MAG TPA: sigma-70 family RNA polymerase sigma factor [Pyrinomonadaceae bacterium]|nr:sigma-70 family RNA polymerase sigma factor [Pyrinomonadaceae bacterium]